MTPSTNDRAPRVRLVLLDEVALRAMLDGDLERARQRAGVALPRAFLEEDWLWRIRLHQVEQDPETESWLVRAVATVPEGVVVGHAGFHGPPDGRGMVEIGYTILAPYRRRGLARAAVQELLRYAEADERVRVVRASISPDNAASLAVIRPFGFVRVGEQWDEDDGLEIIYERELRGGPAT